MKKKWRRFYAMQISRPHCLLDGVITAMPGASWQKPNYSD